MKHCISAVIWSLMIGVALVLGPAGQAGAGAGAPSGDELARRLEVHGGLVVQIGGSDLRVAMALARTGRFLVHVLDRNQQVVRQARAQLAAAGLYGLASADQLPGDGRLPYTENLVNLLLLSAGPAGDGLWDEIARVVCPRGVVAVAPGVARLSRLERAGLDRAHEVQLLSRWTTARKPWPVEMDQWSHPRHGPDGNAVSQDLLVGPPRRVRWLAGPWQEVVTMVTAGGRNYYAGVLARDSFNGLRLWQRHLRPSPAKGGFEYPLVSSVPSPVANEQWLFAFSEGKLLALDGATGQPVREYPQPGTPHQLLLCDGKLLAVDAGAVRAWDADSGEPLWTYQASEPRYVVAGDGLVGLIEGSVRRGEKAVAVALDLASGRPQWKRPDLPWASKVTRCVYHGGLLAYEVSTLSDDGPGNAVHLLSARDGQVQLDHPFLPGMNHKRQARPLFVSGKLWLLHGGRADKDTKLPVQVSAVDLATGEAEVTYPAGLAHCFPPVATPNYLFSGEMDLTDLRTGRLDANRITKGACGRDSGWVPANGLIYVTPKHCVCWPMLRGYVALAAERPGGNPVAEVVARRRFVLQRGVEPPDAPNADNPADWPCYRHDAWRSASTTAAAPGSLELVWSVNLGPAVPVEGPIVEDWQENPFVKGPVTAPVVAGGLVYVARPDAHQVVALDAATGRLRWQFTASGRVDTAPTIHRGLCLFGSKSGWVYCLRADDGQLVWRLRAAPIDERIVAYGQLESPWPVPGSVLVVDDVAYFAAGRQPLADGGILVFAVEPATGAIHWVQRLDSVPQKEFYNSSAMEFDNFDLLHREGSAVAMSRWLFDRRTGKMSVEPWKAFARLNTGGGSAMVPQGCWSYAPRHQKRTATHDALRPLVTFRDNVLFGSSQDKRSIYRRDFNLEGGEQFDTHWITGWEASKRSREGGQAWRSQRLAEKAKWSIPLFDDESNETIQALVLADDRLLVAGSRGHLLVLAADDGRVLTSRKVPPPLWDGLAVAGGRVLLAAHDGRLVCLGQTERAPSQ